MAKNKHPVFQSTLKDKTRELLLKKMELKKYSLVFIASETKLSEQWIGMFAKNEINSPDVGRVETLYKYLANKELVL